ncbi:hypothetical protein F4680DRAFT_443335 [Xylaria scruposa]|nr:hypothetical protein F4680DRAFT_443335 [Xylaria scruposa]
MNANTEPADQYPIQLGVWTNWSRGRVMGSTLTLKRRDADLLIAFTAFFIAFVASRTWRILCFGFHRSFSTSTPQSVIYHQRQAILRNSSSPENGMDLLFRQLWSGRYKGRDRLYSLLIALIAVISVTAFTVTGGFSARISTGVGDEALIRSTNCGTLYPNFSNLDSYYASLPYVAEVFSNAANYAQQCYSSNNNTLGCSRFMKPRLNRIVDFEADCPFSDIICRNKSGNILLDTGYLDTHEFFGLNAPRDQRVLWRNVLHCAPLATAGFTEVIPADNATLYYYGSHDPIPYLYKADSVESQYERVLVDHSYPATHAEYKIDSFRAAVANRGFDAANSDFMPADPLNRDDADMHVILLSGNGVLFPAPTADEWYRVATTPSNVVENLGNDTRTYQRYLPLEPASALGCADQHQFCNSALEGTTGCGPLASLRDAIKEAVPFFNTSYTEVANGIKSGSAETSELARFVYMASRFFGVDKTITAIVAHLGSSALLSQRTLIQGDQGPLPSNQWQLDVNHLWDISLAVMQASFIDTAYGQTDSSILQSWISFTSPALKELSYGSFSLFGVLFTLVVGLLIVLVSYLLEPISGYLCKRGHSQYAHLEWMANGTLQLQRLAHEELGSGIWSKCIDDIPAAEQDELLGSLDISDLDHPVLRPPQKKGAQPQPEKALLEKPQIDVAEREDASILTSAKSTGVADTVHTENTSSTAVDDVINTEAPSTACPTPDKSPRHSRMSV